MEEQRLWELVAKRAAREATQEELDELNSLLEQYPEALYTMETVEHYWNDQEQQVAIAEREEALARHMQRFQQENMPSGMPGRTRRTILRRMLIGTAAAAAVAVVAGGIWYFNTTDNSGKSSDTLFANINNDSSKPGGKKLVTANGTKNQLTLPDGSKVWLNAGSTLTWEEGWSTKEMREVTLVGEGFFEVRHDDDHPFVIHTSRMDIKDVGTSFNVKDYPTDSTTEATLIEGSIEVTMKNGKKKTLLSKPHEKVIVYDHKPSIITKATPARQDSLVAETAWMKDMLVFRNETFEELAVKMERWYDVTIEFNNETVRQHRFTGIFSNETIEQALNELKLIYPFRYTNDNGKIVIQ